MSQQQLLKRLILSYLLTSSRHAASVSVFAAAVAKHMQRNRTRIKLRQHLSKYSLARLTRLHIINRLHRSLFAPATSVVTAAAVNLNLNLDLNNSLNKL